MRRKEVLKEGEEPAEQVRGEQLFQENWLACARGREEGERASVQHSVTCRHCSQ